MKPSKRSLTLSDQGHFFYCSDVTELLFYDSVAFVEKVIHLTMQRLADQIQGMTAEISFQTGDSILKYRTGMPVSKALSVHVMPREEYADCTR